MPSGDRVIGQAALIGRLGLRVPSPAVTSVAGPGGRRTMTEDGRTVEKYPAGYGPEDSLVGHLKFALKYEPLSLGVLASAFKATGPRDVEAWIASEPTGGYARRAWWLYERLTGERLDVPDAGAVASVAVLDTRLQLTAGNGIRSARHKVIDNLLGVPGFAPTLRRTPRLEALMAQAVADEARALVDGYDPEVLARATGYLYTKETRSSFQIENEVATGRRAERFVAALRSAKSFEPAGPGSLVALQNMIVDPRYAARGFRDFQNFVGETVGGYREIVHFICPRPQDLPGLMSAWAEMAARLRGAADPVVEAALIGFGLVFLHPFEDGNGRIHRFLLHHVLSAEGFSPPDLLFPVSAAILRDRKGYDAVLETFSGAIAPHIDWRWTPEKEIEVLNDTADLYRYWDATPLAEYLYAKVIETVRKDLREELNFVSVYDGVLEAIGGIVDMPDRRASLLARCLMQNGGRLAGRKRGDFPELTDGEIAAIEGSVRHILDEGTGSLRDPA